MPHSTKILLVDDESRLRDSLASLLANQGYEIQTAEAGKEALFLIKKNKFDIALFDLMLPDMSGIQLIEQVKKKNPDTFVIMMTGNASVESAVEALRKGAYDYLRKPFDFAELLNTIQNALSQKQLEIENRKIHRQLAVSQRHYRYLVDNSPDIIYTLDHNGHFTYINNSVEHMTGLKSQDVIGSHYSRIIGKRNAEKWKWLFNERRTGRRVKKWDELQLLKFDSTGKPEKEPLFAEVRTTGMYRKSGRHSPRSYMGTHGVIRNITDKKLSEIKNTKIKTQLQRAEKMEAVGTLASGVAHDLNNVLSSVLGYPELILMDMPKKDPNRDYILQIKKSGEKAAVIVKDLLTLARRGVPISDVVDLDTVICDYLTSPEYLELNARYPEIVFNINLNSRQKHILGSPVHLSKCLMNLLSNAAEAMPDGGEISVSTHPCYMDKSNQINLDMKEGEYIKLIVSDSGTGIHPEDIKKIFDPFYTRKKMGRSGTGLGMTIVWAAIKDHNGHIDVHSEQGRGTTFTLYFPVTRTKKQAKEIFDMESIKGKGQSLLIVDDIEEQRKIASKMLSALGYKVFSVASGEEAITYIKKHQTDLIILDMVLESGFDGLDTYREIKKANPSLKVIVVSGLSETDRIKKALYSGVRQYVKKPYSMKTIGLALNQELGMPEGDLPE